MAKTNHSRALKSAFIFGLIMTVGAAAVTLLAAALHSGSFTLVKIAWPGIYLSMLVPVLYSVEPALEFIVIVVSNFIAYALIWYIAHRLYCALRRRMNQR